MSNRTPSRRAVLGSGASLLLLATAAAGQAKAEELDGELLRCCTEFHRLQDEIDRLNVIFSATPEHDLDREMNELFDDLNAEWWDCFDEAMDLVARTPEGIRAKAGVLHSALPRMAVPLLDKTIDDAQPHERFAWSLVCDMLGRPA